MDARFAGDGTFENSYKLVVRLASIQSKGFYNMTLKEQYFSDDALVELLETQRAIMIAVSTRTSQIEPYEERQYFKRSKQIEDGLKERDIKNTNPFPSLSAWYGKWSSGDLPSYNSRREYTRNLFDPLITQVKNSPKYPELKLSEKPTGWTELDTELTNIRVKLAESAFPRDYQTVALLCRDALITLAQIVYDKTKHKAVDGVDPGKVDAKRMLEAVAMSELSGGSKKYIRSHLKAAINLAVNLQHKRNADFRDIALCAEATASVVNLFAIITGQRDPEESEMGQQGRFGIKLSDNAMKVAQLFSNRSANAFHHDPSFNLNEVMEELSISREEAEEAFDELYEKGLLKIQKVSSNQNAWPNNDLFIYTDPFFQGCDPIEDAEEVCQVIIEHFPREGTIAVKDIDEMLKWSPRRINPAITYLVDHEIVNGSSTLHPGPYIYLWVMASPRTRRYAKEE